MNHLNASAANPGPVHHSSFLMWAKILAVEGRTRLNAISGYAEIQRMMVEDGEVGDAIQATMEIRRSAGLLHRNLRRFQLWSQLESADASRGRQIPNLYEQSVFSGEELEAEIRAAMQNVAFDLNWKVENESWVSRMFAGNVVETVLAALVEEAIQHSEAPARIEVRARREGNRYRILVTDHGFDLKSPWQVQTYLGPSDRGFSPTGFRVGLRMCHVLGQISDHRAEFCPMSKQRGLQTVWELPLEGVAGAAPRGVEECPVDIDRSAAPEFYPLG